MSNNEMHIDERELKAGEEKCEIVFKLTWYIAFLDKAKKEKSVPQNPNS